MPAIFRQSEAQLIKDSGWNGKKGEELFQLSSLRPGLSRGDLKEERPDLERRNVPVKFSVQKSCGVPVHAERRYRSPCAEDGLA